MTEYEDLLQLTLEAGYDLVVIFDSIILRFSYSGKCYYWYDLAGQGWLE